MHKARLFKILELGYRRKLPVRGRSSTLLDILTIEQHWTQAANKTDDDEELEHVLGEVI